ncbi:hypothetical protein QTP70_004543 [Hemibagrus guttatus]|uniref:rRNA biogenesis protein RRP36 n=1 Tax=Hemibagrus guttatus TaxID=175788 RepID=A0AAE0V0R1_9TELE|nr:hypothetical protein QTP70_004543 [Hemibagrus guttatus]
MASKKRQKSVKQNLQDASNVQMKTDNQKSHKTASLDDDEEEDALEMERNFALFSKRGSVQTSKMIQDETSGEESDDAVEDEENTDEEHDHSGDFVKERTDMTGSEDSYNQRDCKRNNTSSIKAELKPDLSTMSFEEIMRLQSKIGTKAYNKLIHEAKKKKQDLEPAKRLNKDRPQEISAKKPVSFFRKVGSAKGPMVKKKLKKVKSNAKKEELKSFLKRMENQKRNLERREQQREKELSYKRKQRALVGDGHRPFYLKKSDKKKLELAEKYSELKKSGKLENFLSKKRKRNAVKDRRKMP